MALELAEGGDLFDYIAQSGPFSSKVTRFYFQQLISGLDACFKLGFCHRDLKPDNLLLNSNFDLILADFGFSHVLSKSKDNLLHTYLGTPGYMAPEIVENQPYVGTQVDLFAAGVILFQMRLAMKPFNNTKPESWYFKNLCRDPQKYWDTIVKDKKMKKEELDEDFVDLVNQMLAKDPAKRYTIDQIKQHPYFLGETPDQYTV